MYRQFNTIALGALLLSAIPASSKAAESYDNCTGFIDTLPATISTQGTWCLRKNLATSINGGNAITINTNNVTIDCNDFKIGGLAAGVGTWAAGITAQERLNITVRNCNIRGFWTGIYLQGATGGGHVVEDNNLNLNTTTGIFVEGDGSSVVRNRVLDTGGAIPGQGSYSGISVIGSVDVIDNTVSGVVAGVGTNGSVQGISSVLNDNSSIRANRIRGLLPDGTGFQLGLSVGDGRIVVRNNEVIGPGGDNNSVGIACNTPLARLRDNSVLGYGFPFPQCSDAGGNDSAP